MDVEQMTVTGAGTGSARWSSCSGGTSQRGRRAAVRNGSRCSRRRSREQQGRARARPAGFKGARVEGAAGTATHRGMEMVRAARRRG
jgi:hypothetical protein